MRLVTVTLVLCFLPCAAAAASTPVQPPVPTGGIAIVSPGTPDLAGYRIVVAPNGDAVAVDLAGRSQRMLPANLTKSLFADTAAAMPLSKLPASPCSHSANAPAPVMVSFGGETSPDVVCVTGDKGAALFTDVQNITRTLYVSNLRSGHVPYFAAGQSNQPAQPAAPSPPPPALPPGGYGGYGHM